MKAVSETPVIPKDIIGMSTVDLFDEITRLRSLLEDLVRAVEPFADGARSIPETWPDDAEFEGEILAGDLRALLEAYLKAQSQNKKEG